MFILIKNLGLIAWNRTPYAICSFLYMFSYVWFNIEQVVIVKLGEKLVPVRLLIIPISLFLSLKVLYNLI